MKKVKQKISFKKGFCKMAYTCLAAVVAAAFLFPLVVIVTNSFMGEGEIRYHYGSVLMGNTITSNLAFQNDFAVPVLTPAVVNLQQYFQVLVYQVQFLFYFWNSVLLVIPIILGQTAVAIAAAYAFSKKKFIGREPLFFIYIITMIMPFQVTLVPNYIIADRLGLVGTGWAVILPGIFTTFGVFLLRQFMVYIPDEYCEAAKIDGAGDFTLLLKVIAPMTKTGIAALGILLFIDYWNMVEQPLVFLRDVKDYPLSVILGKINETDIGIAFAASTLYMAPALLVFLNGEEYLVEGLQMSGIKG